MKNILLTLVLTTAAMAVASVSKAPLSSRNSSQQASVFDAKGVAVLPAHAALRAKTETVLAQIDDCCGDPLPECPPICPDPSSDSPMAPMTPLSPIRPKLPPSRPVRN